MPLPVKQPGLPWEPLSCFFDGHDAQIPNKEVVHGSQAFITGRPRWARHSGRRLEEPTDFLPSHMKIEKILRVSEGVNQCTSDCWCVRKCRRSITADSLLDWRDCVSEYCVWSGMEK